MFAIDREKQRDIPGLWSSTDVNSVETTGRKMLCLSIRVQVPREMLSCKGGLFCRLT